MPLRSETALWASKVSRPPRDPSMTSSRRPPRASSSGRVGCSCRASVASACAPPFGEMVTLPPSASGAASARPSATPGISHGRYSVKVLPWPSSLSAVISPRRRGPTSRAIDSPRPVPPYRRLSVPSPCWNAPKIVVRFSGAMPMPVSDTENARMSPPSGVRHGARPTRRATCPRSVNLIALASRLPSTWRSRCGSVNSSDGACASVSAANSSPFSAVSGWDVAWVSSSSTLRPNRSARVCLRPPPPPNHHPKTKPLGVEGHPPRLDLGQVKDVVDELQQIRACRVNDVGVLDLLGGQVPARVLGQQPGQDQQAVQRRAQLVGHVGEELRLVFRRQRQLPGPFLDLLPGLLDLGVLGLDIAVLRGQQGRLVFQLGVGPLQFHLLILQLF